MSAAKKDRAEAKKSAQAVDWFFSRVSTCEKRGVWRDTRRERRVVNRVFEGERRDDRGGRRRPPAFGGADARVPPAGVRGSRGFARPPVSARPRALRHAREDRRRTAPVGRRAARTPESRAKSAGKRSRIFRGCARGGRWDASGPDVPPGHPAAPSRRRPGRRSSPGSVSARPRASRGRSTRCPRRARSRFRETRHGVVSARHPRWLGASSRRRRAARPRSWSTCSRSRRSSRDAFSLRARTGARRVTAVASVGGSRWLARAGRREAVDFFDAFSTFRRLDRHPSAHTIRIDFQRQRSL